MKARVCTNDAFQIQILAWEVEDDYPIYTGLDEVDLTDAEAEWVQRGIQYFAEVQKLLEEKRQEGG